MKENLKVNILWLLLLLLGYGVISLLVSFGILNLFHIQILEQIGINIIEGGLPCGCDTWCC